MAPAAGGNLASLQEFSIDRSPRVLVSGKADVLSWRSPRRSCRSRRTMKPVPTQKAQPQASLAGLNGSKKARWDWRLELHEDIHLAPFQRREGHGVAQIGAVGRALHNLHHGARSRDTPTINRVGNACPEREVIRLPDGEDADHEGPAAFNDPHHSAAGAALLTGAGEGARQMALGGGDDIGREKPVHGQPRGQSERSRISLDSITSLQGRRVWRSNRRPRPGRANRGKLRWTGGGAEPGSAVGLLPHGKRSETPPALEEMRGSIWPQQATRQYLP